MKATQSGIFNLLRFEAGVHRIQRVPKTEQYGRIHTSTVTVAIIPWHIINDVTIDAKDLWIESFRSGGPGGQNANMSNSAVRVTHIPSGISVVNQEERSNTANREKAIKLLRARIMESHLKRMSESLVKTRSSQTKTAARSEKIRTYNFASNRITDHRLKEEYHDIEKFMEGDLIDDMADQLKFEEMLQKLNSGKVRGLADGW